MLETNGEIAAPLALEVADAVALGILVAERVTPC